MSREQPASWAGAWPSDWPAPATRCAAWCATAAAPQDLERLGCEVREGNVLQPWSLQGAGTGVDVAYYLVHSMGRGGEDDYRSKDREGATAFAQMARREGIDRVVYLGGLGDNPRSEHLRSRHETAETLIARRAAAHLPARRDGGRLPGASRTGRCATWSSACPR